MLSHKFLTCFLEVLIIGLIFVRVKVNCHGFPKWWKFQYWIWKEPSGQNLADSVGNPQGLWLLVEGIHIEIWVVSETRIHVEIQGKNYIIGVGMRGKFPQTCQHFDSPKNDIKSQGNSPSFHLNFRREIKRNVRRYDPLEFPHTPINLRGNLGDMDGSPAGLNSWFIRSPKLILL